MIPPIDRVPAVNVIRNPLSRPPQGWKPVPPEPETPPMPARVRDGWGPGRAGEAGENSEEESRELS